MYLGEEPKKTTADASTLAVTTAIGWGIAPAIGAAIGVIRAKEGQASNGFVKGAAYGFIIGNIVLPAALLAIGLPALWFYLQSTKPVPIKSTLTPSGGYFS